MAGGPRDIGPPRDQAALREALERIYGLTYRQQLRLHFILRDYLGGDVEGESEVDQELRERAEVLEALRVAADHLKLPAGTAPNGPQFTKAVKALGMADWNVSRVQRAYGRWSFAAAAYEDRWHPDSSAQRSLRRQTSGRRRWFEDYIVGVREWLTKVEPAMRRQGDYDDYVKKANPRRMADGRKPLVKADTVRIVLALPWKDILAVAQGQADADDLAARREKERIREAGPLQLVGANAVALRLGWPVSLVTDRTYQGHLPRPVAYVSGKAAWFLDDIEAYEAGREWPKRRKGAWQRNVMDTEQVAERLGIAPDSVRAGLHVKRPTIPPPAGKVASAHYWLREDVMRFKSPATARAHRKRSR